MTPKSAVGRRLFSDRDSALSPARPARRPESSTASPAEAPDDPEHAGGSATSATPEGRSTSTPPALRTGPGRPPVHNEPTEKTTVVLRRSNLVYLDRTSAAVRAASGTSLRRSEIIRALVDALERSGLDISAVQGESELEALLRQKLDGRNKG